MPSWLGWLVKYVLDWGWGKLWPWIKKQFRIGQISRDENKELNEFSKIKQEVREFRRNNPDKPLPPELEKRYRDMAARRAGGL